MRDWGLMLGGLLVWAAHFLLVYAVASVADISDPALMRLWRAIGVALTGLCLLALIIIVRRSRLPTAKSILFRQVAMGGCLVGAVAVVLQSLPLLISA